MMGERLMRPLLKCLVYIIIKLRTKINRDNKVENDVYVFSIIE